jgi:hypothetical protein
VTRAPKPKVPTKAKATSTLSSKPKPKPRAKPAAKQLAARKPAAKKPVAKKPAPAVAKKPVPRGDFGAPIAGFFTKQPKPLRPLLEELRDLVHEVVPDAESSIKWGMPFFTIDGTMMCALAGHKSHVNLILSGPPGTYADPDNRLIGAAKTGRHLKLTATDKVPREAVRGWLATAAALARSK